MDIFYKTKNRNTLYDPLLPIPMEILHRYKDHPHCKNSERILPVWSNQKLNEFLKEIGEVCGISKEVNLPNGQAHFCNNSDIKQWCAYQNSQLKCLGTEI